MSRIVIDCEFVDLPWKGPRTPLWVGLACEDGRSWSGVNAVMARAPVSGWTAQHVLPLLSPDEPHLSVTELAASIRADQG